MNINPTKWTDEFSVGIKSIDTQHKKLVDMIKTLHNAIADGKATEVLDKIFSELLDYTNYHFSYEEELFKSYGYTDEEVHKKEHAELKNQLLKLKRMIDEGDSFMGEVLVLKFLQDWLLNHIMKSDKKYGPFLVEKGIK
jgi:hemerythrin-like metal-binding protein